MAFLGAVIGNDVLAGPRLIHIRRMASGSFRAWAPMRVAKPATASAMIPGPKSTARGGQILVDAVGAAAAPVAKDEEFYQVGPIKHDETGWVEPINSSDSFFRAI